MPNVNDLKDSKFMTQDDVGVGVLVTITGWDEQDVSMDDQPKKIKYVLHVEGDGVSGKPLKGLVLNSINGQVIASIAGSGEFKDWIGKQVVLWQDKTVSFGNKLTGGIRVRAPQGQATPPAVDEDIPF